MEDLKLSEEEIFNLKKFLELDMLSTEDIQKLLYYIDYLEKNIKK